MMPKQEQTVYRPKNFFSELQALERSLQVEALAYAVPGILAFLYLIFEFNREEPLIFSLVPKFLDKLADENTDQLQFMYYLLVSGFIVTMFAISQNKGSAAARVKRRIAAETEKARVAEPLVPAPEAPDPAIVWRRVYRTLKEEPKARKKRNFRNF